MNRLTSFDPSQRGAPGPSLLRAEGGYVFIVDAVISSLTKPRCHSERSLSLSKGIAKNLAGDLQLFFDIIAVAL